MSAPREGPAAVPRAAAWLGGLGLLPFLGGAAGVWLLAPPRREAAAFLLDAYGAVILSFLGAVHWGLVMGRPHARPARAMTLGVLPALLAWLALSLPHAGALVLLAIGFLGAYALDARAAARGLAPAWYPRLRLPLTAAVLACLGAALAAELA